MELAKIRWLNARLLHIFLDKHAYTDLGRFLGKSHTMAQKWFNRKGFTKTIGERAARDIEKKFDTLIIEHTDAVTSNRWLDIEHHRLWATRLHRSSSGDILNDMFTTTEMHRAIEHVLVRIDQTGATMKPADIASLCVKMLPVLSDDEMFRIVGLESFIDSAGKIKKRHRDDKH